MKFFSRQSYVRVCVCVCTCARVCVCVCACACACVCLLVSMATTQQCMEFIGGTRNLIGSCLELMK